MLESFSQMACVNEKNETCSTKHEISHLRESSKFQILLEIRCCPRMKLQASHMLIKARSSKLFLQRILCDLHLLVSRVLQLFIKKSVVSMIKAILDLADIWLAGKSIKILISNLLSLTLLTSSRTLGHIHLFRTELPKCFCQNSHRPYSDWMKICHKKSVRNTGMTGKKERLKDTSMKRKREEKELSESTFKNIFSMYSPLSFNAVYRPIYVQMCLYIASLGVY